MPYDDPEERRKYQRAYYKKNKSKRVRFGSAGSTREDKKVLVAFRVPLSVIGRIRRMVNEGIALGHFPWKTQTECLVAMVVRGMESLAGDPTIDEMLPYLRAVQTIESVGSHRREAQAAFSSIKTEIAELLAIKATDEAVQYFHAIYHSVDEMNANVWRDWLLKQLTTTFPQLVKQKPKGVSFIDKSERKGKKGTDRDQRRSAFLREIMQDGNRKTPLKKGRTR